MVKRTKDNWKAKNVTSWRPAKIKKNTKSKGK